MSKLESELQRLYFLPGQPSPELISDAGNPAIKLVDSAGLVRCMVVSVARGCHWEAVEALYQGVQADFDLPAPAIAVSAEEGYQIWFSLAEPVPLSLAQLFMNGLCHKYLPETPARKLKLRPGAEGDLAFVRPVPAKQHDADRWSAFIDPTMGSMFVEESWLEMAPAMDKQAGLLAGLETIKPEDFQRALGSLRSAPEADATSPEHFPLSPKVDSSQLQLASDAPGLNIGSGFTDPKSFLLSVMNEPSASADLRMKAAIALLPYFAITSGK